MTSPERHHRIVDKLSRALSPEHLAVDDESHNHSVKPGAQSHFKVVVVAAAFDGLSMVRRHQLVYGALAEEMKSGLHALAITAKTPTEWGASAEVAASPACMGGSKADRR